MKRKLVIALLAALTLTLGGISTVSATTENQDSTAESTEERPGYTWVVDKPAEYDTIHHEAVYDTIHHEAEGYFETVHHEAEGYFETVHHEAEGHYETQQVQTGTEPIFETKKHWFCRTCDLDLGSAEPEDLPEGGWPEAAYDHFAWHTQNDPGNCVMVKRDVQVQTGERPIYEEREVWIETKPAYDEQVWHETKPAYDEQVWHETKPAWDETVLVSEAWDETILVSPEEGHWEPVNTDPEEPTDPDQPENPGAEEPADPDQPENPGTEEPVDPDQPDDSQTDTQPTEENTNSSEDAADTTKAETAVNETTDKGTAPQTGDPTSLGYLIALGSTGLASCSYLSWKLKNRK